MSSSLSKKEAVFERRRKKLLRLIKGEAALFVSSNECTETRDQHYSFRQDSDLLYLTGIDEPQVALLLRGTTQGPRSVLFLRERHPEMERWVGETLGVSRAKRRHSFDEVRPISELSSKLNSLVEHSQVLHYSAGINTSTDHLVWGRYQTSVGPRLGFPHTIRDARLLTSELRVKKSREEIQSIRHACEISARSLKTLASLLPEVKSERHAARVLEAEFARYGAPRPSFHTIVASGKNATVLHHSPSSQPLWKSELVLVDSGVSFNGYASDITRVFPTSGSFTKPQAEVYDAVHEAVLAGLELSGPGSDLDKIHDAAVRVLTKALIRMGVISGPLKKALAEKSYRPYFMHRTSHWLGLDVHDIAPIYCEEYLIPPYARPLEPGNVFTIEPGLYFDPKDKTVPKEYRGIGVRLEEDVAITSSGHNVLTSSMPIAREEIESLVRQARNQKNS